MSRYEPIKTENELRNFILTRFGIEIPNIKVCDHHTTPWRAFADAYFVLKSVSVWKASRGFGGKSFLLALLGLTEAITLGVSVAVLGGSGEQSIRVHEYMQNFWDKPNSPSDALASDPSERRTRLVGGHKIEALQASMRSVRGPHPTRLRMDEIDEMELKILDAAMGQPMSRGGILAQTVFSSTHHYADGTMTEILKRAGEKGWPVYEWCWRETHAGGQGWLDMQEVESKRADVTDYMWQVEYEMQEPSPEHRAIMPDKVAAMFDRSLGVYEGEPGEYIEFAPPVSNGLYAHGADWARKQDWTVVITLRIDIRPFQLVAYRRTRREPWKRMTGYLNDRTKRYGGAGMHDGTGIGDVVDEYVSGNVEPFIMVGRKRDDLISEYVKAIEAGEIVSPYIASMETEHRLASVDDLYGAGHLPDTISAGALAYRAARNAIIGDWSQVRGLGHDDEYVNKWA